MLRITILLLLFFCLIVPAHAAKTLYVTDQLFVSVRQSTAEGAPIVASLRTGDAVEVLAEQGRFLKVRTAQGSQGFVIGQYFTSEAPASTLLTRTQKELEGLKADLANAIKERDDARAQLKNTPAGAGSAALQKAQADLVAAESKYQELAASAKEVVAVTQERDQLKQELLQLSADLETARQQGGAPQQHSTMRWFLAGAGVLFFGWILGKLSRQKRRY